MWPALLVLAASAFLKYQNDKAAVGRQENLRQAMEAYQRQRAHENEAATQELVQKQTPKERASELSNVTADRAQSLKDTVGAAQAFDAAPTAGKLSSDYRAVDEANASRIAERTRRAIEQLAVTGAPGEQQRRFALRFGKAAGSVDAGNRAIENVGAGYSTDIRNVRPNPFVNLLSQVGMGVGGGMLAGPAGAAAGGAEAMGTDAAGNYTYEDSAGNPQRSSTPYRTRLNRGFSLWGTQ